MRSCVGYNVTLRSFLSPGPNTGATKLESKLFRSESPMYPAVNLGASDGPQMNAVAIIFIVLSFITLVLRYISRLFTHVSIELDDLLIVVAAVRLHDNRSTQYIGR